MKVSYLFSSSQGDVPVDGPTLARPFIVRPFQNHPFVTLGDYFLAVRNLLLREDGRSLTVLLGRLWGRDVGVAELDSISIRYEKYGTLYHISSAKVVAGAQGVRLTVSAALTEESKEALDREFGLLQRLTSQGVPSFLPQVYCKHEVQIQKAEGSEAFLLTISEWFDSYHEWHFSTDEEGNQRTIVWDTETGYRFMSKRETYDLIRQATSILTTYYDAETHHRIFPWHHGAGDFVVKTTGGAVEVKLVTARGYEPIVFGGQGAETNPLRALVFFFLETTVKMRLDKYEGMGESTWADASVVGAAVEGFLQALGLKESAGALAIRVDDVIEQLKGLSEGDLKRLLDSHVSRLAPRDASDYAIILSHIDDHARDLYRALHAKVENTS